MYLWPKDLRSNEARQWVTNQTRLTISRSPYDAPAI